MDVGEVTPSLAVEERVVGEEGHAQIRVRLAVDGAEHGAQVGAGQRLSSRELHDLQAGHRRPDHLLEDELELLALLRGGGKDHGPAGRARQVARPVIEDREVPRAGRHGRRLRRHRPRVDVGGKLRHRGRLFSWMAGQRSRQYLKSPSMMDRRTSMAAFEFQISSRLCVFGSPTTVGSQEEQQRWASSPSRASFSKGIEQNRPASRAARSGRVVSWSSPACRGGRVGQHVPGPRDARRDGQPGAVGLGRKLCREPVVAVSLAVLPQVDAEEVGHHRLQDLSRVVLVDLDHDGLRGALVVPGPAQDHPSVGSVETSLEHLGGPQPFFRGCPSGDSAVSSKGAGKSTTRSAGLPAAAAQATIREVVPSIVPLEEAR